MKTARMAVPYRLPTRRKHLLTATIILIFFLYAANLHSSTRIELGLVSVKDDQGMKFEPTATQFDANQNIELKDDNRVYFQDIGAAKTCFVTGTDVPATMSSNSSKCVCRSDYHGNECGIPSAAWFRSIKKKYTSMKLVPRKVPRRLIHGLNINHEMDFFRVRLEELADAVDVYIACESNYTAHGDPKPFLLNEHLQRGFMKQFHDKIVYVPMIHFPVDQAQREGWLIDMYLRTYMGVYGLERIHGVKDDDLFVLLDADEIPTRQVLTFLKLYDGYGEPIRLAMRWSVFGYFWKRKKTSNYFLNILANKLPMLEQQEDLTEVTAISTMAMLRQVCNNNTFLIRKDMTGNVDHENRLKEYRRSGHMVSPWTIGLVGHYAGFHCSWCYTAEGILTKLKSAHVDDKPRWGDYEQNLNTTYIEQLVRQGRWFDGSKPLLYADLQKEKTYAPEFVIKNPHEYTHLLHPVSKHPPRKF